MLERLEIENSYLNTGKKFIIGIDEVGRGPLAGPLYTAACVLDLQAANELTHPEYAQIRDSKKLSEKKRLLISKFVLTEGKAYSIQRISHKIIDSKGISQGLQMGFYNSVMEVLSKLGLFLNSPNYIVLTDAFKIAALPEDKQVNIKKGDDKSITIGAASIIAKVARDSEMKKLAEKYPLYGFEKHKGYGTKQHMQAIKEFGPCEIHRKSFEPVKSMRI